MKFLQSTGLVMSLACILAAVPASAATQMRKFTTTGARLCTLSVPTLDAKARPKATGFRNEGTTNIFVVCGFDSNPGQSTISAFESPDDPVSYQLLFSSFDGKPHSFSCTGVNSFPSGGDAAPMQYVQKQVDIDPMNDPFAYIEVDWLYYDFGASSHIPTSGNFSITCLLPPGAAILFGAVVGWEDVGS
jgi:hypothetical protein